ncbi:Hint domain-containing protein [Yoonia litorea]|nr:Hint domain-containing protein [Yoonia litorea]
MAAAHPAFEQVFSVIKQGSLVQSEHGLVSVEDVYPGDRLRMSDGNFEVVQWRGGITINPQDIAANAPSAELTRITADALGYNRPSPDLVLGYGARILHRAAGIRRVSGSDAAFIPASDFIDGDTMIALRPATNMTLFQFGFHGQRSLEVNGVPVETLHPGSAFNLGLRGDSLRSFLALFPHKTSFEDFGMLHVPRLRLRDLDLLG